MPDDGRLVAVALAGGQLEQDFRAAGYDAPNKAYLRVGGVTMLERVLSALRSSAAIGRIRCVTPRDAMEGAFGARVSELCDDVVAPGGCLIDSVLNGFAGLGDDIALLVATDIPLVTSRAVDAFAVRLAGVACDIGYGFVSKRSHDGRFPRLRHTWVRLREGTFCGGGISAIRASVAENVAALLRRVAAARKSPLRLAAIFSPQLILRLLAGKVSIAELERRADQLTGLRCRGIACDEPEIAANVDCLADLHTIEEIIRGRA